MSAWIVSKDHIDCIVQAMIAEGLTTMDNATMVGRVLWRQNHHSVDYRYNEESDPSCWRGYRFRGIEAPLDDAIVLQQLWCYEYQSCEDPGWEHSPARVRTNQLATALRARGVQADGPWGIDHIEQAVSA